VTIQTFGEEVMRRRDFLGLAGATIFSAPRISIAQTTSSKPLRVVVIANVYHEADGLMAALSNQLAHSTKLSAPYSQTGATRGYPNWPRWPRVQTDPPLPPKDTGIPRCLIDVFKAQGDSATTATMEIWCIDDLATTKGASKAKVDAMAQITNYTNPPSVPDGVIAFGTGGYPGLLSNDGCAAIGGTVFLHDASNGAPGAWTWPDHMDMLVQSKIPASFFSSVSDDQKTLQAINNEMITPQNHPASLLQLIISADAVAVSSVNEPPPYCDADLNSVTQARAKGATNITSVETTHGVIRSVWRDAPFIYVTAIPNRICHFDDEARSNYAQEFPSSHNAGVALKHVIPHFVSAIAS
jgi:hypothetical protein